MTSSIHPTVRLADRTTLVGKWHKRRYQVIGRIGEGSRGSIYLVQGSRGRFALKISKDSSVITREAKILKVMRKVQGVQLGPFLFDVDDAVIHQTSYSFYVMEYIEGIQIKDWYQPGKFNQLATVMKQLLFQLHHIHQAGYIFGDLKLENLLIDRKRKRIRLVDFGGVTKIGRSVREYTSQYDRGYWQMGERRAEPSYDLFAVAMCMLQLDPTFRKYGANNKNLMRLIDRSQTLVPFHSILKKAVSGSYTHATEMKRDLDRLRFPQQRKNRRRIGAHSMAHASHQASDPTYKNELIGITAVFMGQVFLFVGIYYWF